MKFTWEADDIGGEHANAGGVIVTENTPDVSEYWMIGRRPGAENAPVRYCLVSLRDGAIQDPMTADELAEYLNEKNLRPVAERSLIESYVKSARDGTVIPL